MDLAQQYLDKYVAAFRAEEEGQVLLSPVSTNAEIYDKWPLKRSNMTQLTYLFDNVPHHQGQLPGDYDRDTGYPADHLKPPRTLTQAFPSRHPEEYPSTIYYSSSGICLEALDERQGRVSEEEEVEDVSVGLSRLREDERSNINQSEYWRAYDNPSGLMGAGISYRSAKEFLLPKPDNGRKEYRTSGMNLPNPIEGMASHMGYGYSTESISLAVQAQRDQVTQARNTGAIFQGPKFEAIPEEDTNSSPDKGKGREHDPPLTCLSHRPTMTLQRAVSKDQDIGRQGGETLQAMEMAVATMTPIGEDLAIIVILDIGATIRTVGLLINR
ncbi:hypothetical protein K438DRAFT_1961826 [Mycena galopus ATCC 62051]|nr:hypothetical protein K438DRAFT_1961826 [Mycena galopus ATCC 62051]